jgi:hypothetical protein
MSRNQIDINVTSSSGSAPGKPAHDPPQTRAQLREQVQQAQEVRKQQERAQEGRGKSTPTARLEQSVTRLEKAIQVLTKQVEDNTKTQKGAPGTLPSGVPRTPSGRGGAGAGGGRVGAALGYAGAAIGLASFTMGKILQVGKASLAKSLEQLQTAGVGGMQYRGRANYFSAAEMGQYVKSRRMAGGRFDLGQETGGYVGGRTTSAMRYASMFGLGAEPAKTVGYLDVMTGGKGEQAMSTVLAETMTRTRGGRIKSATGTETVDVIRQIGQVMEDAVKAGISDSTIAQDMAREVKEIQKGAPNQSARFAMSIQKTLMDVQQRASKGQFGDLAGWQMTKMAMDEVQSDKVTQDMLVKEGVYNKAQLERGLRAEELQFGAQYLLQKQPERLREKFVGKMYKTFGGDGTIEERQAKFHRIFSASVMPGWTPAQTRAVINRIEGKRAANNLDQTRAQASESEKRFRETIPRNYEEAGISDYTEAEKSELLRKGQLVELEGRGKIRGRLSKKQLSRLRETGALSKEDYDEAIGALRTGKKRQPVQEFGVDVSRLAKGEIEELGLQDMYTKGERKLYKRKSDASDQAVKAQQEFTDSRSRLNKTEERARKYMDKSTVGEKKEAFDTMAKEKSTTLSHGGKGRYIGIEALQFSKAAVEAQKSVKILEKSFIDLVGEANGSVKGLAALNKGLGKAGTALSGFAKTTVEETGKLVDKGIGGYIEGKLKSAFPQYKDIKIW